MQAEIDALNVGLTRTRVPTATPEDDRGEKAEPRRYALLTLIRHCVGGVFVVVMFTSF